MAVGTLTGAARACALLLLGAGAAAAQEGRRWDEALRAARSEPDAVERSRRTVEARYGAGDLPGALVEARRGLTLAPDDLALLRRSCELAVALRLPEGARESLDRLHELLPSQELDESTAGWWGRELARLGAEVTALEGREARVDAAVARSRVVSLLGLGVLAAGIGVLSARSGRPAAETRPPASD